MDKKCEVCGEGVAKYTCPGCRKRTCSLECVKQHKTDTACNGLRNKTQFVAVKEFGDLNLLNDYRFLEDTGRKADNASRDNYECRKRSNNARTKLTVQCSKRDITLLTMPYTMSRRRENNSRFLAQEDCALWSVEWLFTQSDAKYTTTTKDCCILREELTQFIHPSESDPIIRQRLKAYVDTDTDIKLLMRAEGSHANSVRYYELNKDQSLCDNLRGKTIIENPTIHVVLSPCLDTYPLVKPGEDTDQHTLKDLIISGNLDPSVFSRRGKRHHGNRGRYHHGNRGRGGKVARFQEAGSSGLQTHSDR